MIQRRTVRLVFLNLTRTFRGLNSSHTWGVELCTDATEDVDVDKRIRTQGQSTKPFEHLEKMEKSSNRRERIVAKGEEGQGSIWAVAL